MAFFSISKNDNRYFVGVLPGKHDAVCFIPTSVPNAGPDFESCLKWCAEHHVLPSIDSNDVIDIPTSADLHELKTVL